MGKRGQKQGIHSQATRKKIFHIYLIQTIVVVVVSALLLLHSTVVAYSALLGAALYLIPNLYFAHRALKSNGQSARRALAEIYVSEIWKMGISILAFATVFILVKPLSPFSLFSTFILMHVSGLIAQVKLNNRFLKL